MPKNYILLDSALLIGKVEILSKNEIRFQRLGEPVVLTYRADQIKEFAFNGRSYESIDHMGSHDFYKRLVQGKLSLFRDKKIYLVRVNATLIPLSRANYQDVLNKLFDCKATEKVSFEQGSMISLLEQMNGNGCNIVYIPSTRKGINSGILSVSTMRKLNVNEFTGEVLVPALSAYLELPLYFFKHVSLSFEGQLMHFSNEFSSKSNTYTGFFESKNTILSLHTGFKFNFPSKRINPFINVGLMPNFFFNSPSSELISTTRDGTDYFVAYSSIEDKNQISFGYFGSLGVEFPLRKKSVMYLAARYSTSGFIEKSNDIFWDSKGLIFGFNF